MAAVSAPTPRVSSFAQHFSGKTVHNLQELSNVVSDFYKKANPDRQNSILFVNPQWGESVTVTVPPVPRPSIEHRDPKHAIDSFK